MSPADRDAEASYANFVRELTGKPLVGMTLAGCTPAGWSARTWDRDAGLDVDVTDCESVRVVGYTQSLTSHPRLRPPPPPQPSQLRTVTSWGPAAQERIANLRILVVGTGSVGMDILQRLAATGVQDLAGMDPDILEEHNRDRIPGALPQDVERPKVHLADRLSRQASTAAGFAFTGHQLSITSPQGQAVALDHDLIFCCVDDRPWARAVLNNLAYADLIPVIDGGVAVDAFPDGSGLRNAIWRSHVVRPGRPCMSCNGQLDLGLVQADKEGLLDDEDYIRGLGHDPRPSRQNVSIFAMAAASGMLTQFVSYLVAPGGLPDPGPLRFSLSDHSLEHLPHVSRPHCPVEVAEASGDTRYPLVAT